MRKIASFCVDHRKLTEGIYISRIDGDIITYDLRFCKPNIGIVLDMVTMHTIEHMMATFLRNSNASDEVIYFGPMGCQTGFYLLLRDTVENPLALIKDCLKKTIEHQGEVFGASEIECGNYKTLDLKKGQKACMAYYDLLNTICDIKNYEQVNNQ